MCQYAHCPALSAEVVDEFARVAARNGVGVESTLLCSRNDETFAVPLTVMMAVESALQFSYWSPWDFTWRWLGTLAFFREAVEGILQLRWKLHLAREQFDAVGRELDMAIDERDQIQADHDALHARYTQAAPAPGSAVNMRADELTRLSRQCSIVMVRSLCSGVSSSGSGATITPKKSVSRELSKIVTKRSILFKLTCVGWRPNWLGRWH